MNINILKDSSELIVYNNPQISAYIGKGRLTFFSNMEANCHWHEDIEFLMPIKGYIGYNVNGNQFFIQEGEGIFINSKEMHYGYSTDGSDCEYICIILNPVSFFQNPYIQENYVEPILESNLPELKLSSNNPSHKKILDLIQKVYDVFEENTVTATLAISSYINQIWKELFESVDPLRIKSGNSDNNLMILKKMLSFIYASYDSRVSLAEIAGAGGICRSKCCKLFKTYLNTSPNDFLNSYRLEKSVALLREQQHTIAEIAYACGFTNSSYYSEIFFKYKGCTPTEIRLRNSQ